MKYIEISKEDGKEKKITKKEALEFVKRNYRNPEYVLQEAERLFGGRIGGMFSILELRK